MDFVSKVERAINLAKKNELNAFIEVYPEAIERAREVQKKMDEGKAGKLAGIIFSIKNNIAIKGKRLTCASKMLSHYIAPYNAAVIRKLIQEDAVIIGSNNMDEFACGSDGTTSAFGPTKNPLNPELVPGGSSSGSASAVGQGIVDCSLGSDTGGSIRCPSAFCGVFGFKPSYGAVSRYGLADMAMSLDQIGPIANSLDVIMKVFEVIRGEDENDETTHNFSLNPLKEVRSVAIPREALQCDDVIKNAIYEAKERFEKNGIKVKEVDIPILKYGIPIYYLTVFAEFSSAMQKYDGLRYGYCDDLNDYVDGSTEIRTKFLGDEVKRRIMLGTFITSKEQKHAWHRKALEARALFFEKIQQVFSSTDLLLLPTMPCLPWKIGEKSDDPLKMYLSDLFTVIANLIGSPAITIPFKSMNSVVGVQLIGRRRDDLLVLNAAKLIQQQEG